MNIINKFQQYVVNPGYEAATYISDIARSMVSIKSVLLASCAIAFIAQQYVAVEEETPIPSASLLDQVSSEAMTSIANAVTKITSVLLMPQLHDAIFPIKDWIFDSREPEFYTVDKKRLLWISPRNTGDYSYLPHGEHHNFFVPFHHDFTVSSLQALSQWFTIIRYNVSHLGEICKVMEELTEPVSAVLIQGHGTPDSITISPGNKFTVGDVLAKQCGHKNLDPDAVIILHSCSTGQLLADAKPNIAMMLSTLFERIAIAPSIDVYGDSLLVDRNPLMMRFSFKDTEDDVTQLFGLDETSVVESRAKLSRSIRFSSGYRAEYKWPRLLKGKILQERFKYPCQTIHSECREIPLAGEALRAKADESIEDFLARREQIYKDRCVCDEKGLLAPEYAMPLEAVPCFNHLLKTGGFPASESYWLDEKYPIAFVIKSAKVKRHLLDCQVDIIRYPNEAQLREKGSELDVF